MTVKRSDPDDLNDIISPWINSGTGYIIYDPVDEMCVTVVNKRGSDTHIHRSKLSSEDYAQYAESESYSILEDFIIKGDIIEELNNGHARRHEKEDVVNWMIVPSAYRDVGQNRTVWELDWINSFPLKEL